jgi:hypothetical protein
MSVYEDALEKRIGRWVQRDAAIEDQLGDRLKISEIVEEVLLNAFEQFPGRPAQRLGEWLEELIRPSLDTLARHPEAEKENVSFIQTSLGVRP